MFFLVLLSIAPAIFWFWFLFQGKEIKILSLKLLLKVFFFGLFLALVAMFIETKVFSFLPFNYFFTLSGEELFVGDLKMPIFIFLLTFFFIAPLEEFLKYLFLRREIFKVKEIDRVIEGIQLGIVLGLGFATIENSFYFVRAGSNVLTLASLFYFRFFLSTLAHVIYSGMLGYYLALAKFHKLYQGFFQKRGLITIILLHGFFNFSLLTQAFSYTIGVVIIAFVVLMKWMIDRRDFETYIIKKKLPISAPLFSSKAEIDTFLTKEKFSFGEIKALSFCPRCLSIKKVGERTCPYCGMRFD